MFTAHDVFGGRPRSGSGTGCSAASSASSCTANVAATSSAELAGPERLRVISHPVFPSHPERTTAARSSRSGSSASTRGISDAIEATKRIDGARLLVAGDLPDSVDGYRTTAGGQAEWRLGYLGPRARPTRRWARRPWRSFPTGLTLGPSDSSSARRDSKSAFTRIAQRRGNIGAHCTEQERGGNESRRRRQCAQTCLFMASRGLLPRHGVQCFHLLDGVCVARHLVGSVAPNSGEAQRHTSRVLRARLHVVEGDLHHQLGPHVHRRNPAAPRARGALGLLSSIAS